MGLVIAPQIKIDEYFESDALSQSLLKKLLGGIDSFLSDQGKEEELFYKEKGNFIIGSAVDCILTGEDGEFDNQYYVSQIENKPSDVEMSIVQMVFSDVMNEHPNDIKDADNFKLSFYPGSIQAAIENHNWQPRWKMETKVTKITEVGTEYFEDLRKAYGKQIISEQERFLIEDIVNSLKTNPRSKGYFDRQTFSGNEFVDVYYQLPIYFKYKGIDCKALLDMVIVLKNPDTKLPEVIQPIDLKTMHGSTFTFINNVKRWRYDIQAAWYTEALKSYFDYVPDAVIRPFEFVVESTSNVGSPLVFKLTEEFMNIGKVGKPEIRSTSINENLKANDFLISRAVKGFEQLVDEYLYHSETEWKEEKVITDNNGVLELTWEGIKQ